MDGNNVLMLVTTDIRDTVSTLAADTIVVSIMVLEVVPDDRGCVSVVEAVPTCVDGGIEKNDHRPIFVRVLMGACQ